MIAVEGCGRARRIGLIWSLSRRGGCDWSSRYFQDESWQQKKLDVEVDVPLQLDLEYLRSRGLQVRVTRIKGVGGEALVDVLWLSAFGASR